MSGPNVLVVDDDEGIGEFVGMALSEEGYKVEIAPHGAVALELVGLQAPDVILLDMRMPIMDGWEFARRYRERPGPHAPIVVMTAAWDAADRAAEITADGVLAKPFDLEALLGIVARFTPRP